LPTECVFCKTNTSDDYIYLLYHIHIPDRQTVTQLIILTSRRIIHNWWLN